MILKLNELKIEPKIYEFSEPYIDEIAESIKINGLQRPDKISVVGNTVYRGRHIIKALIKLNWISVFVPDNKVIIMVDD